MRTCKNIRHCRTAWKMKNSIQHFKVGKFAGKKLLWRHIIRHKYSIKTDLRIGYKIVNSIHLDQEKIQWRNGFLEILYGSRVIRSFCTSIHFHFSPINNANMEVVLAPFSVRGLRLLWRYMFQKHNFLRRHSFRKKIKIPVTNLETTWNIFICLQ
jgi:hypothetical protein